MADKTTLLLLGALRKALAEPGGLPLHGARSGAGLFPATAGGTLAARRCLDEGLLQPVPGKSPEAYQLSEQGLGWLLNQASPRQVLEDLVRAVEARAGESAALLASARQMQSTLEGLKARTDQVLTQLPAAPPSPAEVWKEPVLSFLARRQSSGVPEDCPLPELYRQARQASDGLSIGGFHDGLRELHEGELIYLHPWTGPLYALPEPPYALLVGHEIAYYASPRRAA